MNAVLTPGLYIVATPIGNLGDLSPRASEILLNAAVVAVEDSRVTASLFRHLGAKGRMTPYHDHNADAVRPGLIPGRAVPDDRAALAPRPVGDAQTPVTTPGMNRQADHLEHPIARPVPQLVEPDHLALPSTRGGLAPGDAARWRVHGTGARDLA